MHKKFGYSIKNVKEDTFFNIFFIKLEIVRDFI